MVLSHKNVGEKAKILDISAPSNLKERLLSLGFTKGTVIDILRKGPKNNLTVYNVRGVMIALRKEEADLIRI